MKTTCNKCDGTGEYECTHCKSIAICDDCNGSGELTICITQYMIPQHHKQAGRMADIKADALNCKELAMKLIEMNPRSAQSYQDQLAKVLKELNERAEDTVDE